MRNIKTFLVSIVAIVALSNLQAADWGIWTALPANNGVTTGSELYPVNQKAPLVTKQLTEKYYWTKGQLNTVKLWAQIGYHVPPSIGNDRAEATINGNLSLSGVSKVTKQVGIDKFAWDGQTMTQELTFSAISDKLTAWGVQSVQGLLTSRVRVDLTW